MDIVKFNKKEINNKDFHKKKEFLNSFVGNKYDVDYVIHILKTIIFHCEKNKFNPQDALFSINEQCKKLLSHLEVEKFNN